MSESLNMRMAQARERWEREFGVVHKGGIPWHEAPLPRRWHRCEIQTNSVNMGVLRCACGAIASTFGPWQERNSRRKSR